MLKSSQKPLRKWEIPSLSVLSAEHTPASSGNSVTVDIHFRSATTTVPTTISKTGWLTFPISRYCHYGFSHTARIALPRNSPISLIPNYRWNPFTLRISYKFVSNLHSAITQSPRTNGHLWIVSPLQKYRWHWQNYRVVGTQQTTLTDVVLLWTLSMNCEEIGRRNAISERLRRGLTCGIMKTQDWWSTTPVSCWSTTIGPTCYALCMTCITYHHLTSSVHTCSTNRYDHQLLYRTRHQWTIATNRHCWWRNDHPTNHLDIVIGTTIQEKKRNSTMDKQLCPMQKTRNSESGIFRIRKGVMLRFRYLILS